jgi:hypothetical protein
MLTAVFYIAFWLHFKEPRRLNPDKKLLMDHLGLFSQGESTPAHDDFPPVTESIREDERVLAQPGRLFLGNSKFLPDGQHTLEEESHESKPGDAFAESISRVFCGIRGC